MIRNLGHLNSTVIKKKYLITGLILLSVLFGQKVTEADPQLKGIDIIENPGGMLPLDLEFTDENGETARLKEFFDNSTPIVFNLVYYECPMLCTFVLNGLTKGLKDVDLSPGKDYKLISLSIDPNETWHLAKDKQKSYLESFVEKPEPEAWKFLVGNEENIKAIADDIGFIYYYDEEQQEYAHAAATFIITGDGKISRYLYGLEYKPLDLKLAILEASEGKIGSTMDRLILYCFSYDPSKGGYVLVATQVMKLGGLVTLIILSIFIAILWRRDKNGKE